MTDDILFSKYFILISNDIRFFQNIKYFEKNRHRTIVLYDTMYDR